MKDKPLQCANQICAGDQDKSDGFTASSGWIVRALHRNEFEGTALAGEAAGTEGWAAQRNKGAGVGWGGRLMPFKASGLSHGLLSELYFLI
jgi:hypothetical protein